MFPTVKFIRHFCTWFEYCLIFCWLSSSLFSFFCLLSFFSLGSLEQATKLKGKELEWQSTRNKQSPMVLDINVSCVVHKQQLRLEPILFFVFLSFNVFFFIVICAMLFTLHSDTSAVFQNATRSNVCSIIVILINKGFFTRIKSNNDIIITRE